MKILQFKVIDMNEKFPFFHLIHIPVLLARINNNQDKVDYRLIYFLEHANVQPMFG